MSNLPGLFAAAANSRLPTAGSNPDWKFSDFFKMNAADEHLMKKAIAMHLGLRYDTVNVGESVADTVDGIAPYKPDDIKLAHTTIMENLGQASTNEEKNDYGTFSGCHGDQRLPRQVVHARQEPQHRLHRVMG